MPRPAMYAKPGRHCHDCGKPTNDYRCPSCQRKHLQRWKRQQGIPANDPLEEEALEESPLNLKLRSDYE